MCRQWTKKKKKGQPCKPGLKYWLLIMATHTRCHTHTCMHAQVKENEKKWEVFLCSGADINFSFFWEKKFVMMIVGSSDFLIIMQFCNSMNSFSNRKNFGNKKINKFLKFFFFFSLIHNIDWYRRNLIIHHDDVNR